MFTACLVQRIEVPTGKQKRRRYTAEEMSRFAALSMQAGYLITSIRIKGPNMKLPREYLAVNSLCPF